jgi:hypothetical protein
MSEDEYRNTVIHALMDISWYGYIECELLMYLAEQWEADYTVWDTDYKIERDREDETIIATIQEAWQRYEEKFEFFDGIGYEHILESLEGISQSKNEFIEMKIAKRKQNFLSKEKADY